MRALGAEDPAEDVTPLGTVWLEELVDFNTLKAEAAEEGADDEEDYDDLD